MASTNAGIMQPYMFEPDMEEEEEVSHKLMHQTVSLVSTMPLHIVRTASIDISMAQISGL